MRDTKTAFKWIIGILRKCNIPFQITGGLAAQVYGSKRKLADIDIDILDKNFTKVFPEVRAYVIFGPKRYKDKNWDLKLLTLKYKGQEIDLCDPEAKIFDKTRRGWIKLKPNFKNSKIRKILGIRVPVISRQDLLEYKSKLLRRVDKADIAAIENY